ncbi:MAG: tyrosine-type recombinase/integrase [Anaerovoracaceae bacterium]
MVKNKHLKIHNKSNKPDNVVLKEFQIVSMAEEIERELPSFMRGFFAYLRNNVLPATRLAYIQDISMFCDYLINETELTVATTSSKIKSSEFSKIEGVDVNMFLDYCRKYEKEVDNTIYVFENNNKTLARKKSSLSVLFKELYREEIIPNNITDKFDPIRIPKSFEVEIKALQDNEVMIMLDAVTNGNGLTKKEYFYWQKTKLRDKAILIMFLTYGLRLSELQQLNVSSFNFTRGEFKIFRKRGKESIMPLNKSTTIVIEDYLSNERKENALEDHSDALFISLQGKRMTERQIRELVKKYTSIGMSTSRAAGYSPHKLRATAATSLIGRGNSIYDVAALLDHEQVTTTQLYAGHKLNVKRDLVKDMEWEIDRTNGKND